MAWIESHQELKDHPKLFDLASTMGWDTALALGKLHLLWYWCVDYAEDGDLRKHNDERIGRAVGLNGDDCRRFVEAMVKAGWLDREPYFRVHDWWDYAGRWLQGKYGRNPAKWKAIYRRYSVHTNSRQTTYKQQTVPNLTKPYLTTTPPTPPGGQWDGPSPPRRGRSDSFNAFGDWMLSEYLGLKPKDASDGEKGAVKAAYRRFGRAIRDILALCRGDPEAAKKGTDAVAKRFAALGVENFSLDAVARWIPDWTQDPGGFDAETEKTRPIRS